jgi:myo-inositol catabolism protein IolC
VAQVDGNIELRAMRHLYELGLRAWWRLEVQPAERPGSG